MNNNTVPIAYGNGVDKYNDPTAVRSLGSLPVMRNFSMMGPTGEWVKGFNTEPIGVPILSVPTLRPRRRVMNLEKWGKRKIVKRLGLIQSAQDKQGQAFELQGFDAIPIGFGNAVNNALGNISLPTRDTWGNLVNKLQEWGTTYFQTEKEKAETKKLEAEAATLQAAKSLKTTQAGMAEASTMMIPVIGGLLLLGIFMLKPRR